MRVTKFRVIVNSCYALLPASIAAGSHKRHLNSTKILKVAMEPPLPLNNSIVPTLIPLRLDF